MKALLVNVTITDREPALAVLREQIVPRASQAPGFVAGYWLVSDDAGRARRNAWNFRPRPLSHHYGGTRDSALNPGTSLRIRVLSG